VIVRRLLPFLVLAAACALSPPAHAQCTSNASSCVTCHETQGLHPVLQGSQQWHKDHGFGDLCVACHGGNPASLVKEEAHLGRRHVLADPGASCTSCHAEDGTARAEQYLKLVAVAPQEPPPPSPPPAQPKTDTSASVPTANRVLVVLAVSLAIALWLVVRRERKTTLGRPLVAWLRDKTWSPYLAGALLGAVVAISEVFLGRPLSASGAIDKVAAYPGKWLFPNSQYYRHVMTPGITWQVWLLLGVLLGSFASSKLSGEVRKRWLPDTQWVPRYGSSKALRLAIAFAGAMLVQIGAGIAGGCTSGLAISGGSALAPAAYIFMAGMFAGGIPAAFIAYRRGKDGT
jgi:uncharacterized protein